MAVLIEHDKRKHEILANAFDLFIEEGYEDVTFQKIADRCNITRTTLYIYFKNKREIFIWSIKQLLSGIEEQIVALNKDENLGARACLERTLAVIVDECEKKKRLFKVLLSYLLQVQKEGGDVRQRIERRIVKLQHFINIILIRGKEEGVFKDFVQKDIYELIFSALENGVFRLALYDSENLDGTRSAIRYIINSIVVED